MPGLAAKPIVDVTAVVTDLEGVWGDLDKLAVLGYELSHVPARHLFLQRADEAGQPYNLHLVRENNDTWKTDLRFREYLRANPGTRERYESAKREAARAHPDDIDAYNAAKREVIESLVEEAEADESIRIPDG